MGTDDPARILRRLMNDLQRVDRELRTAVYRRSWDKQRLKKLREEKTRKREEIDRTREDFAAQVMTRAQAMRISGGPAQEPMTVRDSWMIANALYSSRPAVYERDQWVLYRRVCAALLRVFANELSGGGEEAFDGVEFLTHCGLPLQEAELLAGSAHREGGRDDQAAADRSPGHEKER